LIPRSTSWGLSYRNYN